MSSKTKKPSTKAQAPLQEPELVARIREALETLALNQTAKRFEELLGAPPADQSRLEWLWALLQPQAQTRVESRLERRIREARLPERKTLETFQFDFQPSLDKDLVLELATLAFIKAKRNVLLAGMSGTGKSHIALALALNACVANLRVRYTTNAAMLRALNASLADDTLEEALRPYTTPELLVIDEVGLEQVERTIACRAGLMQKVLLPRYEKRSTIITSNIPWDAWGDYLQDHLGAGALVDRLLHHSHVIVVNGPSWRDHQHKLQVKEEAARRPKAAPAQKPASKTSK
ncbi:MAG: IS21-like element helper ATPase IstB [Polyangiaceae bacterium]|jgi:DNA replication protein DnaC|nr:IS21-like element helper ATPase IstB [Polyangiaceae bacterium]